MISTKLKTIFGLSIPLFIAHGIDPELLIGMGVGSLGASTLTAQQKRFVMLQVIYTMPQD